MLKGRFANQESVKNYKKPNFTLKQIRDRIPAHLFQKSLVKSLSYAVLDVSMIVGLCVLASRIEYQPTILKPLLWTLYSVAQGIVGVGIWILAHGTCF